MSTDPAPVLEPRDENGFVAAVTERLPGYVPGLVLAERSAGAALTRIFARYAKVLADRVNLAPDKNRLAFYDQLGVELLTAQAARAPIAFTALPNVGDSHIPPRSRVGAKVPDQSEPLVFETERGVALTQAKLTDVITLWPGRDAYADHSADALTPRPFTLYTPLAPVRHELYLGHDVHFALAGQATVEIELDLTPGTMPVPAAWEYWDGELWREFKPFVDPGAAAATDSVDGTAGFTRPGVVQLVADCATSVMTEVNGITTHWLRVRVIDPLPPDDAAELPVVDRVTVRTVIDRSLPAGTCGSLETVVAIIADQAFAGETKLDLTKTVQPLGGQPQAGSTFAFACDEILTKPGAEATLCFTRVETPEEKADQSGGDLEADVAAAEALVVEAARQCADTVIEAAQAIETLEDGSLANSLVALPRLTAQQNVVLAARAALAADGIDGIAALEDECRELLDVMGDVTTDGATLDASRAGATASNVREGADDAIDALEELEKLTPMSAAMAAGAALPFMDAPVLRWEYWNGRLWRELAMSGTPEATTFRADGPITFTVPEDIEPVTLNGVTARFVRARLVAGGYGLVRTVSWKDESTERTNFFPVVLYRPPNIAIVRLGYIWRSAPAAPTGAVTYNDFQYADVTANAGTRGESFAPFAFVADRTPAVYFGFDLPLPADTIGLYADLEEVLGETDGPALTWELHDGSSWLPLHVEDETHALAIPGMLAVLWPGTPAGAPQLARFGTPRTWIRARLTHDGPPRETRVIALIHNSVWAAQQQTFENETIGSSNGEPKQVFFARSLPVLPGEILEVRELVGERASVEEPMLREELLRAGIAEDAIRVVRDVRTGRVVEVWVTWRPRPNLLFAELGERAYAIERSRGRVIFGGGAQGLAPPAGRDNIRLRQYQSGGGVAGNVAAGGITQLLSGVLAEKVANGRAAEGGADGEVVEAVRRRAPAFIRHRRQAISAADYEDLAREASPAVAVARALPTRHPSGRTAPGWVTIRIVPHAADARPMPSFELRDRVREFIAARVPAQVAGRVAVIPPVYQAIGVEAVVRPLPFADPAPVKEQVDAALARFLHPLTGGPDAAGWPFGRDVYLSDVASLLESVADVDAVETLMLLVDGTPVGDRADVPDERLVVAGDLRVTLSLVGG